MKRHKNDIVLPEFYDPKVEEKNIHNFWHKEKLFQKVQNTRKEGVLSFYSGPVFPTGYPHSGHILNSIVKDVFTRYGHKKHLKVETRFGWDCHGIAVERKVDKKLGIKLPADVESMGIANYNEECRDFVQKQAFDWRTAFERIGNCVDFDNEYHTMSTEYMQKVWWVFKQLYEKGLVYNATKVMPYSTGCFTHLSNFEAEQNMKEVTETGYTIVVSIVDSSEKLLIWTTSPSSLASNVALCANPKSMYVKVQVRNKKDGEVVYILSKNSLPLVFPHESEYTVVEEFLGTSLKDLKYEPLFGDRNQRREWDLEEFVADDLGSGIVPFDEVVLESLKQRGLILKVEDVTYTKPFCWRSNTPLIHKRVNSWHIRVESIIEDLLKNSSEVNWCWGDESNKMEFNAWLEKKCKDWTIGRTRYWGTPIPIWISPSGDEVVCVGSIEELEKLVGKTNITNIHREVVDWIKIPSKTPGNPPLRRVPDVFDCWFESGAVPFALNDSNAESLTVDFVAEGSDQTRGWFYTILVLSTALSQPTPFRNVISTGLVLNPDGSKLSKRRHNHNEPMRLIEKYGADAFRLYLLSSPLVEGENMEIQEEGVVHITEKLIQPLWRVFKFCTSKMASKDWVNYGYLDSWDHHYTRNSSNFMTGWILSCTESVAQFYSEEMNGYRLKGIVQRIIDLLEKLENWYIPSKVTENYRFLLPSALFNVVYRICLMLAPFAPFITEYIYQKHRDYIIWYLRLQSIHEANFYPPIKNIIDPKLELCVFRMQGIIGLVRKFRTEYIIPKKYKIHELILYHHNKEYQGDIDYVTKLIMETVNVSELRVLESHRELGAVMIVELKKDSELKQNRKIAAAVKELKDDDLKNLFENGQICILDQTVSLEDIQISYEIEGKHAPNYTVLKEENLLVGIRMNKEFGYYEEGAVKEMLHHIKALKRKGNYYPNDKPTIFYSTNDECLNHLMSKYTEHLGVLSKTELSLEACDAKPGADERRIEEVADIKGNVIKLHLQVKCETE